MFDVKYLLKIGVPAVAGVVTVTVFSVALYHRNQTIRNLKTQMQARGIPVSPAPEKIYEPTEVDHHYDRRGYKIYLSDQTFGQIWLPVLSDVPLSAHPVENMVQQSNGRMTSFDEHGNLNALTGIDISAHNTVTDWAAVKADGIDFVMLRAGYRGYGVDTGTLKGDDKFREYYKGAKKAGLLVGAYFFSQAITEEEAVEEAILTAKQIEGCELDFPVAYDWELIFSDSKARTDNVPVETLTDCVLAYCQNMESFGYQTAVYQNKRTSLFKLDLPRIKDIPFWLTEYDGTPTYIYQYDMWQYSCKGTVAGITGQVDMNLSFRDFSKEGAPVISLPAQEGMLLPGESAAAVSGTDGTGTDTTQTATETTAAAPDGTS